MMTFRQLAAEPPTLPMRTMWYLTDLAEARGKQESFTRQSPQKLKVLREHALIKNVDLIRQVLKRQKDASLLICLGCGPAAKWRKAAK
jgi:hypothetical protein